MRAASEAARTTYRDHPARRSPLAHERRLARRLTHRGRAGAPPAGAQADGARPDVLLDVSTLNVHQIDLELDDLRARVSLAVQLLELLKLDVGADADLGQVRLRIEGLQARARLEVRLGDVARIVERTMETLDHNPALVDHVADLLGAATGALGTAASRGVSERAPAHSNGKPREP